MTAGQANHIYVEAPTLYPTEAEFRDPIGFLSKPTNIELAEAYGVLKLVPPKGWKPSFSINKSTFKFHTRLQTLRELNIENRPRIFFLESLENFFKMRNLGRLPRDGSITLSDKRKVDLYNLFVLTGYGLTGSSDSVKNWKKLNLEFKLPTDDRQLKNIYDKYLRSYAKFLKKRKHKFSHIKQDDDDEEQSQDDACMVCYRTDDPTHTLICDGCEESYHMKCLDPPLRKIPEGEWYCDGCLIGTFDYGFEEDFDVLFTVDEFDKHCQEFEAEYFMKHFGTTSKPSIDILEKEFWKLVNGESLIKGDDELEVRYGADIHSENLAEISGFPTNSNPNIDHKDPATQAYSNHPFNLTNLPFAEGSLLNHIKDAEISGMTVPWIYVGSLFSTFCWHKEDHYTLSSNYCHFGSTKKWYGIPAKYECLFEDIVYNSSPEYFKRQPDLLHQLVTLLSPKAIFDRAKGRDMTIVYANQNENEFIITYPKVYHAGFNSGLNFNEAVNFTMPYWVKDADRAVSDYKKVQKENVFNYYQLSSRILAEFLQLERNEIERLQARYNGDYLKMIELCLRDLVKAYQHSNQLTHTCGSRVAHKDYREKLRRKQQQQNSPSLKEEEEEEEVHEKRGRKRKMMKDSGYDKDDELLCDVCKTYLSFRWVTFANLIDNETENSPKQLLTPKQTPKLSLEGEIRTPEENEFQRIILEAKRLSEVTDGDKQSVGLGLKSEDSDQSEEPAAKRRKSRRLQNSFRQLSPASEDETQPSKAKKKQAFKRTTIKLCLDDVNNFFDKEQYKHHRKLFRNFQTYDDFNSVFARYATFYYDCDENDINELISGSNKKLNSMTEALP